MVLANVANVAYPAEPERAELLGLIQRIVTECPRRRATSAAERRAQAIVREHLARLGLTIAEHPFVFNDNLHANVVLHAGVGLAGTAVAGVAPLLALGLHLLAGSSYLLDATRRAHVLRRLLPFYPSQNLLATMPAVGPPRLRVVLLAHADAAPTGWVFSPALLRRAQSWTRGSAACVRPMALFTQSFFALAGCDLARLALGPLGLALRPLELLLAVPSLIVMAASLDILLRDHFVPGANDDLSGVAALPVLAARLARGKPPEVELVFAVTGCEEPGLGGADALARTQRGAWDPGRTVIIALDSVGSGDLRYFDVHGDVVRGRTAPWLVDAARAVAASDPRFAAITPFRPPMCETDAAAFVAHGYAALGLVGIDPVLGVPSHYHLPSDTPENLDLDQLMIAIDYTEQLVRGIMQVERP